MKKPYVLLIPCLLFTGCATNDHLTLKENERTFEYGEAFYVALLPVEPLEGMDDGEVLLMKVEEDGEEDVFLPVETEEELEGAWNAFLEIYYDDEDGIPEE